MVITGRDDARYEPTRAVPEPLTGTGHFRPPSPRSHAMSKNLAARLAAVVLTVLVASPALTAAAQEPTAAATAVVATEAPATTATATAEERTLGWQ